MPASTSSKTSVRPRPLRPAATDRIASWSRESSPPDAIFSSGFSGSPGIGREQERRRLGARWRGARPRPPARGRPGGGPSPSRGPAAPSRRPSRSAPPPPGAGPKAPRRPPGRPPAPPASSLRRRSSASSMFARSPCSAFSAASFSRISAIEAPYLRFKRAICSRRDLERREPVRIGLDRRGRVARSGGEVRDAAFQVLGLVAVRRLARVDRRELRERPGGLTEPVGRRALVLRERAERGLPGAADPVACRRRSRSTGRSASSRSSGATASISWTWNSSISSRAPRSRREASRASSCSRASFHRAAARGGRVALGIRLRERVEQLEGGARIDELLLGALAVDRHEPLADPAERAHRRGLVVDEGAPLAVGRELAPQKNGLALRQARARELAPGPPASASNSPETVRRGAPWRTSSAEPAAARRAARARPRGWTCRRRSRR